MSVAFQTTPCQTGVNCSFYGFPLGPEHYLWEQKNAKRQYAGECRQYDGEARQYIGEARQCDGEACQYGGDSPSYCWASPSYCRPSPSYCRASPSYCRASPTYCRAKSTYCRASPSYCRASPSYRYVSPSCCRASPSYRRSSPFYCRASRLFVLRENALALTEHRSFWSAKRSWVLMIFIKKSHISGIQHTGYQRCFCVAATYYRHANMQKLYGNGEKENQSSLSICEIFLKSIFFRFNVSSCTCMHAHFIGPSV